MKGVGTPLSRFWRAWGSRVRLAALLAVWGLAVVGGIVALTRYSLQPGRPAAAPAIWPSESHIHRQPGRPSLVMIAHPRCACTRASLGELAVLMTRVDGRASASLLFVIPAGTSPRWGETDLRRSAAEIPGVTVIDDEGGREAKRFGTSTSGQVLLYDASGHLRYSGGITGGRGHAGDNAGRSALQAQLVERAAGRAEFPVFGCELFSPKRAEAVMAVARHVPSESDLTEATARRATELFDQHRREIFERTDRTFAGLLLFEWALAIILAFTVSPRAWAGASSSTHPHLLAAILLGGAIISVPVFLAARFPGRTVTRHTIATAQMLTSALLIHLTGGRIETHFHVFGSLAFLVFYRDWRVYIPATLVVALDHYLRGLFWPQSVYGVLAPGVWRWLEHAAWVVFEDVFLILSCLRSVTEMRGIAERQARLEATNQVVEAAVTARTRELAESEQRFEAFMDNSPAAAWMKSDQGTYVYVNRTFQNAIGVTREQCVGSTDRDHWEPELAARMEAGDRQALAGGDAPESLESVPLADGAVQQWSIHRFAIEDAGDRRLVGGIAYDMTEKMRLAGQLRESQRMEAVGRLAGGIAHDFNNLLATITGYSRLLLPKLHENPVLQGYAREISNSADRAASLTMQLLAYTRQQVLQPKVLDLNVVLTEMGTPLKGMLGAGIELETILSPGLSRVKADPSQVDQVLLNLVLNARDAMPNGGRLTLETANVEIGPELIGLDEALPAGSYVLLTVSDTGQGMDSDTKAKIFEPFFTTKGIGKATGLGLSTVQGIVRQSGGHVLAYSEIGVGTTMKVYLPAADASVEPTPRTEPAASVSDAAAVILLVDDEEGVRSLVREVLKMSGYEVIEATQAEEAIEVAQRYSGRIDALVSDVVLPGISGIQLADNLSRTRPGIRVLLMSGYPGNVAVGHGLIRPGDEFIQKPFMPDALTEKVRALLSRERVA